MYNPIGNGEFRTGYRSAEGQEEKEREEKEEKAEKTGEKSNKSVSLKPNEVKERQPVWKREGSSNYVDYLLGHKTPDNYVEKAKEDNVNFADHFLGYKTPNNYVEKANMGAKEKDGNEIKAQRADMLNKPASNDSGSRSQEPDMSLFFDGESLVARKNKGDVILRNTYPAVSGIPDKDGGFDNSRARQKMVGEGPIPEGQYWINPQNVNRVSDTPLWNQAAGLAKVIGIDAGLFPGGRIAWGEGRIDILPKEVDIDGVKRSDLSIHGGWEPGSAGCIDLGDNESDFFKFVEKYRGKQDSIPLSVKYKR